MSSSSTAASWAEGALQAGICIILLTLLCRRLVEGAGEEEEAERVWVGAGME